MEESEEGFPSEGPSYPPWGRGSVCLPCHSRNASPKLSVVRMPLRQRQGSSSISLRAPCQCERERDQRKRFLSSGPIEPPGGWGWSLAYAIITRAELGQGFGRTHRPRRLSATRDHSVMQEGHRQFSLYSWGFAADGLRLLSMAQVFGFDFKSLASADSATGPGGKRR